MYLIWKVNLCEKKEVKKSYNFKQLLSKLNATLVHKDVYQSVQVK